MHVSAGRCLVSHSNIARITACTVSLLIRGGSDLLSPFRSLPSLGELSRNTTNLLGPCPPFCVREGKKKLDIGGEGASEPKKIAQKLGKIAPKKKIGRRHALVFARAGATQHHHYPVF